MAAELPSFRSPRALLDAYKRGARFPIQFSKHALERYVDMHLSKDEVAECVHRPGSVTYQEKYDAVLLNRDRITVSVKLDEEGRPFAATILWRTNSLWEAAARVGKLGDGRHLRHLPHLPA